MPKSFASQSWACVNISNRHSRALLALVFSQSEWVELIDDGQVANAAQRGRDLSVGWLADPIFLGHPNPTVTKLAPEA